MSAQVIGYLGENGVRDVRIPIGHLLDKWQGLRPSLVMVPVGGSDDEAYPVQYTLEGTDLVWHVSDADTAVAGTTKAAVRMVDDSGRVGMDEPFQVIISPNLSAGGEPPLVIKPWVDKLATLVPRAEAAAERAENATERAENAAERVETGTAPNALALDSKPPSYYLPAVQLLDNPDFAIAQAGHGGWHGNGRYAACRWIISDADAIVSYDETSGLTVGKGTGETYIEQCTTININKNAGKSYTFAVYADGDINVLHVTLPNAASKDFPKGNILLHAYSDGLLRARIRVDEQMTILRARLLPGTYTADNLPPNVPPDPTLELAKCQQHFTKIPSGSIFYGQISGSGTLAYAIAPIPQKMLRDTPSKTFSGTITIFPASGSAIKSTEITAQRIYGNTIEFSIPITGGTPNEIFIANTNADIDLYID